MLITERSGALKLRDSSSGQVRDVAGVPPVIHAGQGGLGDIAVSPTFASDKMVYLSWVRAASGGSQAVVGRARLDESVPALVGLEVIWEQTTASGSGHFSHRIAFADGHLFVTSGDRQAMAPAQGFDTNLGKVLRLDMDGRPAAGNPWASRGGVAAQFWTMGHRNPLGIAVAPDGRLWSSEMGPAGGDELNLLIAGRNYGWPLVSMGSHYGGGTIPDHSPGDGFEAPKAWWVPAISPGSLMIYRGTLFQGWAGDAFLGGLSGQNLVRVHLDGDTATVAETWPMETRVRAVAEASDGAIWLLTDGSGGQLLELRPR